MTAKTLTAAAQPREDGTIDLLAPTPGLFRGSVRVGDIVRGGGVLGALEILGHASPLVVPATAHGAIVSIHTPQLARPAVDFGAVLVTLDPRATSAVTAPTANATTAAQLGGLVFRAPTSGRFYGRPTPDKPPFVTVGAELATGGTICLLEVMKTFNRVTYGGVDLPERVRVREVLVAEGADVSAGEPLLALEPI